ncbi:MBOAT family protein [Geminicoccaceae bacterium 1502E]|nr:MBOAT family protein [Geminicoccaceae bacterium 1502E]
MLFNSDVFITEFLPIVLAGFLAIRLWRRPEAGLLWLLGASIYFYGYWSLWALPLLLGSILGNYLLGELLRRRGGQRGLLALGVGANLALLFWFKYASFAAAQLAEATGNEPVLGWIVLPIGISFFTFQQIAYLVDIARGETVERHPLRYALFVSFFPQLIAGPIVHHRELAPQFARAGSRPWASDLAVGATIFTIGLAKKVLLADNLAHLATPAFEAAAQGGDVGMAAAWTAAVAWSLQIYFDFSGYSDMAIGLGRLFGIVLPINFASPYKAASIVEFWRRWHVTLSRFLRDYLYIPLGGNRHGRARQLLNIFLTMLLGGIWHGAGWTFVLWGAMHGAFIVVNHLWQGWRGAPAVPAPLGRALTLLAVILAWVPFRAADLATTGSLYGAMLGLGSAGEAALLPAPQPTLFVFLAAGAILALWAPNTQTLMRHVEPGLASPGYASGIEPAPRRAAWRPRAAHAILAGFAFAACMMMLNRATEFIYFQF